jgi:hypothetical protein
VLTEDSISKASLIFPHKPAQGETEMRRDLENHATRDFRKDLVLGCKHVAKKRCNKAAKNRRGLAESGWKSVAIRAAMQR